MLHYRVGDLLMAPQKAIVLQCENFGKISASLAMSYVRNLLNYR